MIELCPCVHANPTQCLMERHQVGESFAKCMGGCSCRCHYLENGALVPSGGWQKNRERTARPVRPARDAILDPRIQELMNEVHP